MMAMRSIFASCLVPLGPSCVACRSVVAGVERRGELAGHAHGPEHVRDTASVGPLPRLLLASSGSALPS